MTASAYFIFIDAVIDADLVIKVQLEAKDNRCQDDQDIYPTKKNG